MISLFFIRSLRQFIPLISPGVRLDFGFLIYNDSIVLINLNLMSSITISL